jgi:hypothetical protein
MEQYANQRQQLLQLLYAARIKEDRINKAYVAERDLTDALGNCQFNLGVLLELGYIEPNGLKYRITGLGVLAAEEVNAKNPQK